MGRPFKAPPLLSPEGYLQRGASLRNPPTHTYRGSYERGGADHGRPQFFL